MDTNAVAQGTRARAKVDRAANAKAIDVIVNNCVNNHDPTCFDRLPQVLSPYAATDGFKTVQPYLDTERASDIARTAATDMEGVNAAHAQLDKIQDASVAGIATAKVDAKAAQSILSSFRVGTATANEAFAFAATISDKRLKDAFVRAVKDAQVDSYGETASDSSYALDDLVNQYSGKLDDKATDAKRAYDGAVGNVPGDVNRGLDDMAAQDLQRLEDAVSANALESLNRSAVRVDAIRQLPAITSADAQLDLSRVEGTRQIVDVFADNPDGLPLYELPKLSEFADVGVDSSGTPQLQLHDGGTLGEKELALLKDAFNRNAPLLAAAMKAGGVVNTRFIIDDDYDPYYVPGTRTVDMVLPRDDSMSKDQLMSGMTHELIHGLVRDIFEGTATDKKLGKMINSTCSAIAQASYENIETMVKDKQALDGLMAKVKPEHRQVIADLAHAIETGTLHTDLTSWSKGGTNANRNSCTLDSTTSLWNGISHYALKRGVTIDNKALDYMSGIPEFITLGRKWNNAVAYLRLFDKFNESNFVSTQSSIKRHLGHADGSANELTASLLNAILNYRDQLAIAIAAMNGSEYSAALQAVDMTVTLVVIKHPELADLLHSSRSQLMQDVRRLRGQYSHPNTN